MKICRWCKKELDLSRFGKSSKNKDGLQAVCRGCQRAYQDKRRADYTARSAAWARANPEAHYQQYRRSTLRRKYGITPEQFLAMRDAQGNRCALCWEPEKRRSSNANRPRSLSIDHCHDTGRIRGLLCHDCNSGIGLLRHSVDLLKKAIDYLG